MLSLNMENSNIVNILEECRNLAYKMKKPNNEKTKLIDEGLVHLGMTDIDKGWEFIKKVYASKFNERAYIATQKINLSLFHIKMSILVQTLIESDYAFVIHTKNPMTNDSNNLYAEVVRGMGESLVGSYPGQALSFEFDKSIIKRATKL